MTAKSVRTRLRLAAAASIATALLFAWLVLGKVFERHVDTGFERELDNQLRQLASMIEPDPETGLRVTGQLADPRFELPFSGLYWQVISDGRPIAASPSLADEALPVSLAKSSGDDQPICVDVPGPRGRLVILVVRDLKIEMAGKLHNMRLAAAMDQSEVTRAVTAFQHDLGLSLAILGACLLAASWGQISIGLSPLARLRSRLAEVRRGTAEQLTGDHPEEVQGLIDELNALLKHQAESIARARTRAGDLAHGLKTPLAALNAVIRDLHDKGDHAAAAEIASLAARMQQHVSREIVRAQIVGHAPRRNEVNMRASVDQLVETMRRLPRGETVEWKIEIDDDAKIAMEQGDFQELVGNLMENALHWTNKTIAIRADSRECGSFTVEDDGPGVPEAEIPSVLKRGESRSNGEANAGLGLAIVEDVASAYGYGVELFRSKLGGLGVRVDLSPRTAAA